MRDEHGERTEPVASDRDATPMRSRSGDHRRPRRGSGDDMGSKPRTTFDKMQKERARLEKQAAKRARRQGRAPDPEVTHSDAQQAPVLSPPDPPG